MTDHRSSFEKFVLESAGKYLQTVVLVDDRIYENTSGNVASHLTKPPPIHRKAALKSSETEEKKDSTANRKAEKEEITEEVSFHDVQNSFAKKRIICSLYQPKRDAKFSETSDVHNLCSAADVVIIDWDLHGDSGDKATLLVTNLVEQSMKDIPYQLRLILIYTMEVNLRSVADKIFETLTERIGAGAVDANAETHGLVLTTDNARVVVLGKRENASLTEYSDFWVPEKKLAERTVEEFSRLASGLLQAIALRGVANIRENNRRILMRFHKGLDSAFLTHRALLLPDEAFGHIIPLLTDELRAVLEDTLGEHPLGTGPMTQRIVTDWCTKRWTPGNVSRLKIGEGTTDLDFAQDVFCNGPALMKDYSLLKNSEIPGLVEKKDKESPKWKEKKCPNLAEYLLGDSDGDHPHEMLSVLMSQRIAYENAPRTLHLGVILREMVEKPRYMLCLQPVCDSVRINGEIRTFIFCFLDTPEDGKPFTHVVMHANPTPIKLTYKPKVINCHVLNFTTTADSICAGKDNEGRFIFEDANKSKYEWIAELKMEHAQRVAEEFGRTLSRVGLTESEWLRLKAKS